MMKLEQAGVNNGGLGKIKKSKMTLNQSAISCELEKKAYVWEVQE